MGISKRRAATVAGTVLTAAVVPLSLATTAGAAQAPAPPKQHHPPPKFAPQSFTIALGPSGPGAVTATGPVSGTGTDHSVSPTLDVFALPKGNVNVRHTDVSNVPPVVNKHACIATISASGKWTFNGGTGKYAKATGRGMFTLSESAKLQMIKERKVVIIKVVYYKNGKKYVKFVKVVKKIEVCNTNLKHQH